MRIAAGEARLDLARELRATDTANTRFDDGSVLVVGDDAAGTAGDDAANDIRIARDYASALDRDNHLIGLGGDDRLVGGRGDDRIQGGGGHDWLTGSAGNDRMGGSFGDDRLLGGDGDDLMTAGRGRDRLIGGMGRDELYGGAGADVFRFGAGTSARRSADHVGDFDPDRDLIDLRPIDPLPGGRDSALDWIGRAAFSGEAGELRQHRSGDDLRVAADLDGDGRSDFVIVLDDLNGLTKDHFLL
jgi:Ca2+-binding RTX toxin-like protein